MEFKEYCKYIKSILNKKNYDLPASLDGIFECYIKDMNPYDCVNLMITTLNENFFEDKFKEYKESVIKYIHKSGIKLHKFPIEIETIIKDLYADETDITECVSVCINELRKNSIKLKKPDIDNTTAKQIVKNKLLLLLHKIDNIALKDIQIKNNEIYADLYIKLFTMRNEINTDIKSYITQLNQYFIPFINQNIDKKDRIDIIGYTVNKSNVYCNIFIKLDCMSNDGFKNVKFSKIETTSMINMYINIFRTFAEQYSNVI